MDQAGLQAIVCSCLEDSGKEPFEKPSRPSGQLALRQRMQPHDFHTSGERVGEPGKEQHIGRPGEDETPRRTAAVHRRLDGGEESRRALDLVQDRSLGQIVDKAGRIGLSCR